MRFREISNECMPDFSNAEEIGEVHLRIGKSIIKKITNGSETIYGSIVDNTVVGFIGLEHYGNFHAMVRNAYVNFPRQGIATSLIHYVIAYERIILLSDWQMSNDGAALWMKIINDADLDIKIVDMKFHNSYELSDIGSMTSDNVMIIAPEKDSRPTPKDVSDIKNNEQRFVYMIDLKKISNISETIANGKKVKIDLPLKSENSILQPIIRFSSPML